MKYLPLFLLFCLACQQNSDQKSLSDKYANYEIVYSAAADSLTQKAALELQTYWKKVTKIKLPVSSKITDGKQQIYIGKEWLEPGAQQRVTDLKEDGFIILSENNTVYLAGENGKTNLYAAYTFIDEFLGCKLLTPTEEFIPEASTVSLPTSIDKIYEPDFAFRRLLTPGRFDERFLHWHKLEELDDWGMFVHTFRHLLSPEEYYERHPEYFSLVNGRRLQDGQLCLSNPTVIKTLTENLGKRITEKPDRKYWSVSQNDAIQNCECSACRAMDEKFGSVSGTYIYMANEIAKAFPNKQISTLAYQFTRSAPKNIKPAANVNVMFCSIECNRSMPLATDKRSASFVKDLEDWSAITSNIFVWDYVVQFKNYLTPFPNFHVLQPNLQLFKKHNVPLMFEQGSNGAWSDFLELKQYLIAHLLWDTDLDTNQLIDEFIQQYYGPAAGSIKAYFDLTHATLQAHAEKEFLDIYGFPQSYIDSHLAPEMLDKYMKLLDEAEAAAAQNPIYLNRVQRVRLPFDFSYLDIALNAGFEHPTFIKEEDGEKEIDQKMLARLNRMVANAKNTGAEIINERSFNTPAYQTYVLAKLERMASNNLAKKAKITSATTYSEKYKVGGEHALIDNKLGGLNFQFNWLGFEGEDMQIDLDFGKPETFSHVNMHFLKDINSWIFLPLTVSVEVSDNGKDFRPIASLKGEQKDHHYLVKSIPFDFKFEKTTARYIRIKADSMQECPIWHRGFGGKSWIFIDELLVN